jgi:predicted DsbA family dithiol-disulfide isomerase
MNASAAASLRVDIVSDVVCPWCIIGYKQLERALALANSKVAVETYWHPFELNPQMADEGEDTAQHIARKYGSTPQQSADNRKRLSDIGDALGFSFNYGPGMRIYNTFKAHKLLTIAANTDGWQAQTALKLALFKAYFQDRLDISKDSILLDIAEAQGMSRAAAQGYLNNEDLSMAVRAEQRQWQEQNITSVPAIIFDQKFMVPGAQSAETFANVIDKVMAKRQAAPA